MATTTQQQPQQQPQEEPRLSPEDIQDQAAAEVDQGDGEAQPHMDRGKGRAARRKKARARSERLPQDGQDGDQDQDADEDVCKARSPSRSQLAKVPSNSPSVLMSSGDEVSGDRESIGTDRRNWTIRSAATCTVSFTISTHRKE